MDISNDLDCFNLLLIYMFSNLIQVNSFYLKGKIDGTPDSFRYLQE